MITHYILLGFFDAAVTGDDIWTIIPRRTSTFS
jgi:hypothetical protein